MILFYCSSLFATNLSLDKFIELAENNDPNFKYILADKEKTKFLIDQNLPSSALLLNVRSEYGVNSDNDRTNVMSASISKNFLSTGTNVSLSRSQADRPDREEKLTEFRLEQSIFRNLIGRDNRLQKESLEFEVQKTKLQIIDLYEDYVQEISSFYFDFGEAYINYRLSEEIYNESKNLNKNVKKRFSNSVADRVDIDRASLELIATEEDMLSKKLTLDIALLNLKRITGVDFNKTKPEVIPLIDYTKELPENKKILRAYEILELDKKMSEMNLKLQDRNLDPEVNLILGYNIDDSNRFNTAVNRSEQVYGVELNMPIGDNTQKANKRQALLDRNKIEISLKDEKSKVDTTIQSLKEQVSVSKKMLKIAKKKIDLAKRIYEREESRYKIGKVDLEQVIESKNNYSNARFQYFSRLINYNKFVVEWLNLTDQLVQKKLF